MKNGSEKCYLLLSQAMLKQTWCFSSSEGRFYTGSCSYTSASWFKFNLVGFSGYSIAGYQQMQIIQWKIML